MSGPLQAFTSGEATRVDVNAIQRELTRLWKEAAEPREGEDAPVTRACLSNLVIWSVLREGGAAAAASLPRETARVVQTHPARVLMVEVEPAAPGGTLAAWVSAYCHRPAAGARQVCCEQVTLRASPDAAAHLPGLLAALFATDLPVNLYVPDEPPFGDPVFRRLAEGCDKVIVDGARFEDAAGGLAALVSLVASLRRGAVADLAWRRLRPMQDLVAWLFDSPLFRPQIPFVSAIRTGGGARSETASLLMAGWIRAALDGRPLARRHDAGADSAAGLLLSVRLEAPGGPTPADFVVESDPDGRMMTARVEAEATCPLPRRARCPAVPLGQLLGEELEQTGRDRLYEEALRLAAS